MRHILVIMLSVLCLCYAQAQEFHCTAQVNYQKLLTTTQSYSSESDKQIFDVMKQSIEDFVGGRRWTNINFEPHEQLECSISLILNSRTSATDFSGQLQLQLKRPVYNSTYTSGLFNYMEQAFSFSFNENQPLDFDMSNYYGQLSSTIAYYCYIMLGIYFDSFSPNGGEPFYAMAQQVAQAASGASGWDQNNSRSRYWFVENHTNGAYADLHQAYYNYHRLGLDLMTKDQTAARQAIIEALRNVQSVHKARANLISVQQFADVKVQELLSIFTPAPPAERKQVYELVRSFSPINAVKLKDFNNAK